MYRPKLFKGLKPIRIDLSLDEKDRQYYPRESMNISNKNPIMHMDSFLIKEEVVLAHNNERNIQKIITEKETNYQRIKKCQKLKKNGLYKNGKVKMKEKCNKKLKEDPYDINNMVCMDTLGSPIKYDKINNNALATIIVPEFKVLNDSYYNTTNSDLEIDRKSVV